MDILKKTYYKGKGILLSLIRYFFIYKHEKKLRSKLKNTDFSIICSSCIGGIIYNRLGLQFLSPTINLWLSQPDYLKLVLNLKEYLADDLEFVQTDEKFPVAKLGDITIHFNHYKTDEEARESWNRRKSRINYNNLFLIMYDRDGITEKDLLKFGEIDCNGKVVISDKVYPKLYYVIKSPTEANKNESSHALDVDKLTGLRAFEKYFDYVKWLNEGN